MQEHLPRLKLELETARNCLKDGSFGGAWADLQMVQARLQRGWDDLAAYQKLIGKICSRAIAVTKIAKEAAKAVVTGGAKLTPGKERHEDRIKN